MFFISIRLPPVFTHTGTLLPYTTLFRSSPGAAGGDLAGLVLRGLRFGGHGYRHHGHGGGQRGDTVAADRKIHTIIVPSRYCTQEPATYTRSPSTRQFSSPVLRDACKATSLDRPRRCAQ